MTCFYFGGLTSRKGWCKITPMKRDYITVKMEKGTLRDLRLLRAMLDESIVSIMSRLVRLELERVKKSTEEHKEDNDE